jgi:methionyl-tRNA formyltransferase
LRFLEKLAGLCPADDLTVFSFPEAGREPRYLDDIRHFAEEHDLRFFETADVTQDWVSLDPVDLVFMVHWRYLVPVQFLDRARLGSVVFHDSLLPVYRGFSPTVWAIVNGEECCGATMLYAVESVDAGDIIDQVPVTIGAEDTIADVMERVTLTYLTMLEQNLPLLKAGCAPRQVQDHSLATFTCKRVPDDNLIDWRQPARAIFNLVRAVTHPYPGAYTFYRGVKVTIWSAQLNPISRHYVGLVPGGVVEVRPGEGIVVLTGDGSLLIRTIQVEGAPAACAADVVKSIAARLGR